MTNHPEIDRAITALERQIHELRREAARVSNSVPSGRMALDFLGNRSRDLYDGTFRGLRRAERYAKREGNYLAGVTRENPVAVSTATIAAVGLIGAGLWYLMKSEK
ncbi:hypothetical protein [Pararhizobium mangrovi]|uniref:Uncharacterized protein n=1 Tax=Pararhizobium mangrovi TaxID=2590452 RepID=A0A506UCD5_9HYPH|nr:hypothetical protein [Pararhizobium mangrovi]TPW31258.1 hypothetical protein FJU11_03405 [Pararhizobium mangrovi]